MVSETPDVEADLTRLTRDYEVLYTNYQELNSAAPNRHNSPSVSIPRPSVSSSASSIRRSFRSSRAARRTAILMAGVLLAGIGAGFALAFLRIQLDETYQSVDQLKEAFRPAGPGCRVDRPHQVSQAHAPSRGAVGRQCGDRPVSGIRRNLLCLSVQRHQAGPAWHGRANSAPS